MPKRVDASFVILVGSGKNGNQRAGIHQHPPHFPFLRFFFLLLVRALVFAGLSFPKPSKWRGLVLRCFAGDPAPRRTHPINPASSASSYAGRSPLDWPR